MAAAVFLDRDGTIIEDTNYIRDPKDVKLLPNAVAGLKLMREKGYLLFIVSNQSGIGRGLITAQEFKAVHQRVCEVLQAEKVDIAEFCYCFHAPTENCQCRKPATGLLPRVFQGQPIDWKKSFTVGDKLSDAQMGDRIGGKGCLILTGKPSFSESDALSYPCYKDLLEMAQALP